MPTTSTPNVLTDAGYLFWAPLATAEPTHASTASKFSDAWPAAWLSIGATEQGSELNYDIKLDQISVAEFFDPIKWVTTERTGSFAFNMADYTLTNFKRAFNGGTYTSATGTTAVNTLSPPVPGTEVRVMLGWESLDSTMRVIVYQCINGGTIKTSFKKAPAFATIPCQFNFEVPSGGVPFKLYTAGQARI